MWLPHSSTFNEGHSEHEDKVLWVDDKLQLQKVLLTSNGTCHDQSIANTYVSLDSTPFQNK